MGISAVTPPTPVSLNCPGYNMGFGVALKKGEDSQMEEEPEKLSRQWIVSLKAVRWISSRWFWRAVMVPV